MLTGYLVIWAAAGALLCGLIAAARGRSFVGWVIAGALFGIFALIYLALAGPGEHGRKHCPGCAELINDAAGKCPHCGHAFAPQTLSRPSTVPVWPGVANKVAAPCFTCNRIRDHDHVGTCSSCRTPNEYIRYWWGYRSDLPSELVEASVGS